MNVKFVVAILVVVLLISFATSEEIYVTRLFDTYQAKLDSIDTTTALKEQDMVELEDWWQSKHKRLELILPHNNLNEITYIYGEMLGAIRAHDDKSAQAQFQRLKTTVEAISEMYGYRVGNIL